MEYLKINKEKSSPKMKARGTTPCSRGWGRLPWARPLPCGPPGGSPTPIFSYMKSFDEKKIEGNLSGRNSAATRRNQSRAPAELFCRGHFPPGGGNHCHRHHECSSHQERAISINIFTSTISSPNPSSSLVSNSCLQVWDW